METAAERAAILEQDAVESMKMASRARTGGNSELAHMLEELAAVRRSQVRMLADTEIVVRGDDIGI